MGEIRFSATLFKSSLSAAQIRFWLPTTIRGYIALFVGWRHGPRRPATGGSTRYDLLSTLRAPRSIWSVR